MLPLLGGLLVFALLATILLNILSSDGSRDAPVAAGVLLWGACLVHADTVLDAAYLDVARFPAPRELAFPLAAVLGVSGLFLFGWATRTLVRDGQFNGLRSERLVRTGPYALMRHPQHTGWGLVLLGVAVAGRSLIGLALVAIFALFVSRLVRAETSELQRRFGPVFSRWQAATPVLPVARRRTTAA